ncbi:DDE-type integrase/transposase/recombinase [Heliorestis convoluta]|uniref:DDE-type integrase/transposase/recombinase n=1 Tax=Heliorestis convoluta TaxID=356322 RepID=A0A5Q2N1C0_9FIRM|nr:DDE-type integrase/transposase/recombinase [Heliorestis convoluta]QGG47386.1 DDE-type integrase/transposase/recombinase [Heliorestis convoluta]
MEDFHAEQVAAFRYSLIAPIVSRQTAMPVGEQTQILKEIAAQSYTIPGSDKCRIGVRTLERYIAAYRQLGWEGLKPKSRPKAYNAIASDIVDKAIALRKERPERSVAQIIYLLEKGGITEPGTVAASTLARYLTRSGVSREKISIPQEHRRFEAEDVHQLWQADFQHTLYIPDPNDSKKRRKAILFVILDDRSRYIVHSQFYFDEKLPRMEDSLKKAILKHGLPEKFYVDNGAVFSSHHLARICGRLAIQLIHSRPYRPQGRGKVEKFFQFVDSSFKPEAYGAIEAGQLRTLDDLNKAWYAWLDGYYHLRRHGATKMSPQERLKQIKRTPRRISPVDLTEVFLWQEQRKVDKTSCVHVFGNIYTVDSELCGEKVILRFDPFDLSMIQVWLDGERKNNAKPLVLESSYHKGVRTDPSRTSGGSKKESPSLEKSSSSGIDFFQVAETERRQQWNDIGFTVAKPVTARGENNDGSTNSARNRRPLFSRAIFEQTLPICCSPRRLCSSSTYGGASYFGCANRRGR